MDIQNIRRLMDANYHALREQNSAESKRRAIAAARIHLSPGTEPVYETPQDNNPRLRLVGATATEPETMVAAQ